MEFKLHTESACARLMEYLDECFSIVDSCLIWKSRPDHHFKTSRSANSWRSKWTGKSAGTTDSKGYLQVKICGRLHLSHRIIWLMSYGEWPETIDHIDGDPKNNSLNNLRSVSQCANMRNQKKYLTNKTGIMGVHWVNSRSLWIAKVSNCLIGTYECLLDACAARKGAEVGHKFHINHGRG